MIKSHKKYIYNNDIRLIFNKIYKNIQIIFFYLIANYLRMEKLKIILLKMLKKKLLEMLLFLKIIIFT